MLNEPNVFKKPILNHNAGRPKLWAATGLGALYCCILACNRRPSVYYVLARSVTQSLELERICLEEKQYLV
jgi:hypothetical protein